MSDKSMGIDLSQEQVSKAVDVLHKLITKKQKTKTLLGEKEKIDLQFSFQKIPATKNITINLKLPNPLAQSNWDVCLFAKDLNRENRDYEPTVRHMKELLNKNGVNCITEVIPLKSLKLEYKPFEAKRKLSTMFDLYLADERIIRLLPSFLGKNFYGRKKIPVGVDLHAKDLKKEISAAVNNSRCYITGKGSSCLATVAHTEMTTQQIAQNIIAAAKQLAAKIPGGPQNIKLFVIKSQSSPSVPLYASTGSPADVELPQVPKVKDNIKAEEITTLVGSKVKVTADGKVIIVKDKKRHRVKRKRPPRPELKQAKTEKRKKVTEESNKISKKSRKCSPADVELPQVDRTKVEDNIEAEEITTLVGSKVKVTADEKVIIVKDSSSKSTKDKKRRRVKQKRPPRPALKQAKTEKKKKVTEESNKISKKPRKRTKRNKTAVVKASKVEHSDKKKRRVIKEKAKSK